MRTSTHHTYHLSDTLSFGKYKGFVLRDVVDKDPKYLAWCEESLHWFHLGEDAVAYLHPSSPFVAGKPKPSSAASSPSGLCFGPEILLYSNRFKEQYWQRVVALAEDAVVCDTTGDTPLQSSGRKATSRPTSQLEIPFDE